MRSRAARPAAPRASARPVCAARCAASLSPCVWQSRLSSEWPWLRKQQAIVARQGVVFERTAQEGRDAGRHLDIDQALAQREQQVHDGLGLAVRHRVREGRDDVAAFDAQFGERHGRPEAARPIRQPGTLAAPRVGECGRRRACCGELADHLVHVEPRREVGLRAFVRDDLEQRMRGQQLDRIGHLGGPAGADRLRRGEREAAMPDAQLAEQRGGRCGKHRPAPFDDALHRRVARIEPGARPGAMQQRELRRCVIGPRIGLQQRQHVARRQRTHARRGQFERERHAVERARQRDQRGEVARMRMEVGADGTGAVDEEGERRVR